MEIILSGLLNVARGSGKKCYIGKVNILSKGVLSLFFFLLWFLYCYPQYSMWQSLYSACVLAFVGFLGGNSKGFVHSALSGVVTKKVKFKTIWNLTNKIRDKHDRVWGVIFSTFRSSLYYLPFILLSPINSHAWIIGLPMLGMGVYQYILGNIMKDNKYQQGVWEFLYFTLFGFLARIVL